MLIGACGMGVGHPIRWVWVHSWLPLVGPMLGTKTKVREAVHYESSLACLGSIISADTINFLDCH